ncbi:hypothetical protein FE257_009272 [Aspergillus nanangensis]|uniref:BZIP domain-containing protein n=1 Tax=Aspergillus nanangensis TaxID=2582783 RepID=A0AAD4CKJ3_ASPNN|nr:hypothetical protein FE257_009272 [Aspergillus nanangensis]
MASKRKSGDLAVPDITDDPAERKRVLNVLAQRRYRERKKEHLRSLQDQVKSKDDDTASYPSNTQGGDAAALSHRESEVNNSQDDYEDVVPVSLAEAEFIPTMSGLWSPHQSLLFLSPSPPPQELLDPLASTENLDHILCLSPPSLLLEPFGPLQEDHERHTPMPTRQSENAYSLSDQLQMHQSSTFTFPDDHLIEIPTLSLLKASMIVARRLNIADLLWDFSAVSPFFLGGAQIDGQLSLSPPSLMFSSSASSPIEGRQEKDPMDVGTLPDHIRPTVSQRLIPHHPVLDVFPWPGTRDKLIHVFSLPVDLRPRSAQDPMGLFRLVYDIEDVGGEGVRIQGQDPFDKDSWEIGQLVFERWWWAFETDIVDQSNRARTKRGEKGLILPGAQP